MKRRFALALLAALAFKPLQAADDAADNSVKVDAARTAVGPWLELIDMADYAGSWNTASSMFRSAVTAEAWAQAARTVRTPLGGVQDRTESAANYSNSLPGAPAGEYVLVQFTTNFANRAKATETVITMLDTDGSWRVAGYLIQ